MLSRGTVGKSHALIRLEQTTGLASGYDYSLFVVLAISQKKRGEKKSILN